MHLIDFYFKLAHFTEIILPIIPIFLGVLKWKKLPIGLKYFLGFLVTDWLINIATNFILVQNSTRFFWYFYSFFDSFFILLAYYHFFREDWQKKIIILLLALSFFSLIIDYFFVSGIGENYYSYILISLIIMVVSLYYFSKNYLINAKESHQLIVAIQYISIVLIFQFFIKAIEAFFDNFLMTTLNNTFLWLQMKNIYYYFMILSLVAVSIIFYNLKFDERKK